VPTVQAVHPHPQGLLRGGLRQRSGDHLRFIRPLTRRDEELPQGEPRRVAQRGARLRARPGAEAELWHHRDPGPGRLQGRRHRCLQERPCRRPNLNSN